MARGKGGNWTRGGRAPLADRPASERMRRIVTSSAKAAPRGGAVSVVVLGGGSEENGDSAAGGCDVGEGEAALIISRARQTASGQTFASFSRYFREDSEVERSASSWHGRVVSRSGAKVISGRYNFIISTVTRRALPPWAQTCTADCDASEWVERYEARYRGAILSVEIRHPLGDASGAPPTIGVEMDFPAGAGAEAVQRVLGWVYPN